MRRLAFLALLAVVACGRSEPEAPAAAPSFRDRGMPIGSVVRGGMGDLAGDWVISQSFPGVAFAAPDTHVMVADGTGATALLRFEGLGGVRDLLVAMTAPGRLAPQGEEGPELWVLWVDDDFRTAAIGTPDGSFGWIMDRPGRASADRTAAAREVLDWSGYDVRRLVAGSGT
jgi:apolipoprotein D and lipocalin family protein